MRIAIKGGTAKIIVIIRIGITDPGTVTNGTITGIQAGFAFKRNKRLDREDIKNVIQDYVYRKLDNVKVKDKAERVKIFELCSS